MGVFKEILGPIEYEVMQILAESYPDVLSNEEVTIRLIDRLNKPVPSTSARNAIARACSKIRDTLGDLEDTTTARRQNYKKRLQGALAFLREEYQLEYSPESFSFNDRDFYSFSSNLLEHAKSEHFRFATKTPVLLLPQEMFNEERVGYHRAILTQVADENINAQYISVYQLQKR